MRVLIACEFSGIVRDAFIARGHTAFLCDYNRSKQDRSRMFTGIANAMAEQWGCLD